MKVQGLVIFIMHLMFFAFASTERESCDDTFSTLQTKTGQQEDEGAAPLAVGLKVLAGSKVGEQVKEKAMELMKHQLDTFLGADTAFSAKSRPLFVTVTHDLPDDDLVLTLKEVKFVSGRMEKSPAIGFTFKKGEAAIFAMCNRDGSIMTGVGGYMKFQGSDGSCYSVAFSNPWSGSWKCKAGKDCAAKTVYDDMGDGMYAGVEWDTIKHDNREVRHYNIWLSAL